METYGDQELEFFLEGKDTKKLELISTEAVLNTKNVVHLAEVGEKKE